MQWKQVIGVMVLAGVSVFAAQARGTDSSVDVSLLLSATAPQWAAAATDDATKDAIRINGYWDNDGGYNKRNNIEDRHVTNAFGFTFSHQPDWAVELDEWIPFDEAFVNGERRHAGGYVIGHVMITPDNIGIAAPQPADRPWAGYLYVGAYWQRADDRTFDHLQFDLGLVGQSTGAEELQKWVHDLTDGIEPAGWDNQLTDEPTFQFTAKRKWKFDILEDFDLIEGMRYQAIPHIGGAAGTVYINGEIGILGRAGWNLPDDFGPGRLDDPVAATSIHGEGWSVFIYAQGTGRVVAHDIFLNGGVFEDGPSVDIMEIVGEFRTGVGLEYACDRYTYGFTYSQTFQSKTFETQTTGDEWGTFALSFTVWD